MGNDKKKAVFLDRDGVINRETGEYVFEPENFEINEGVFDAMTALRDAGFILIVISNQGGIGKGLYTHSHVEKIHNKLKQMLSLHNLELAEIYYCPHYPSSGKCLCRKPGSLLVEKAIARFNIDPSLSFMIGDKESDTEAALRAGVKGILINANESILNYIDIITNGNGKA